MSRELIKTESMSLTADRGRMIQTMKRSRHHNKYAYIKEILQSSTDRNASKVNVIGTPGKITLRDDGRGILAETLDEKLATIFTDDEMDALAGGILSSFDANVEEVVIESVPGEGHGEAYSRSIFSENGEIYVDEPEPLDGRRGLSKGTRVTLYKQGTFSLGIRQILESVGASFVNGGIPELQILRNYAKESLLDVRVNFRKVKSRIMKPECIVEIEVGGKSSQGLSKEDEDIKGKVGLISQFVTALPRNGEPHKVRGKVTHAYRKGFFYADKEIKGRYGDKLRPMEPPVFAEIDYDKLKVDIAGARLTDDNSGYAAIRGVVDQAIPALYEKLLEDREHEQTVHGATRRAHLLNYQVMYLSSLVRQWEKDNNTCFHNKYYILNRSGYLEKATQEEYKDLNKAILKEELFESKDRGRVSLESILDHIHAGRTVWMDNRGFDYERICPEDLIIQPDFKDDLTYSVLSRFDNVEKLSRRGALGEKWTYYKFESKKAKERKKQRESLEEKLKVPLLYRPVQMGSAVYDVAFYDMLNPTETSEDTRIMDIATGLTISVFGSPVILGFMAYSVLEGTLETVALLRSPLEKIYGYTARGAKKLSAGYNKNIHPTLSSGSEKTALVLRKGGGFLGRNGLRGGKYTLSKAAIGLSLTYRGVKYIGTGVGTAVFSGAVISAAAVCTAGQFFYEVAALVAKSAKDYATPHAKNGYHKLADGFWATVDTSKEAGYKCLEAGKEGLNRSLEAIVGTASTIVGGVLGIAQGAYSYSSDLLAPSVKSGQQKLISAASSAKETTSKKLNDYKTTKMEERAIQKKNKQEERARQREIRKEEREKKKLLNDGLKSGQMKIQAIAEQEKRDQKEIKQELREKERTIRRKASREYADGRRLHEIMNKLETNAPFKPKKIRICTKLQAKRIEEGWKQEDNPKDIPSVPSYVFESKANPGTITIISDSRQYSRLHDLITQTDGTGNLPEYLGSLIIHEARIIDQRCDTRSEASIKKGLKSHSLVCQTMQSYHMETLDRRIEEFEDLLVKQYNSGNTHSFTEGYKQLDEEGRLNLLYKVIGEPRQDEIDDLLESDPEIIELLEEAGRKRIKDENFGLQQSNEPEEEIPAYVPEHDTEFDVAIEI